MDELIELRSGLMQAVADGDAVIDLMASLPAADFCHSETLYAALRSPNLDTYYGGDEVMVVSNGNRAIVHAADYRSLTNEKAVPHSHAKHSTFRGSPFMVGSLARLTVNPRRLTGKLAVAMKRLKLQLPADNPMDNNKAQALELINDVERALEIIEQLLRDGVKDERALPGATARGHGHGHHGGAPRPADPQLHVRRRRGGSSRPT